MQKLNNETEEVQLEIIRENGEHIQKIENPSEEVQLEAVKENGENIKYIEDPSEEVQLEAVQQDGFAIEYIEDPSEEVQLEAVEQILINDLHSLPHLKNPTEEMQLKIVFYCWQAIQYIKNPTEKVQLEAVKQDSEALVLINCHPSEEARLEAKKGNKSFSASNLDFLIEKILVDRIKENGFKESEINSQIKYTAINNIIKNKSLHLMYDEKTKKFIFNKEDLLNFHKYLKFEELKNIDEALEIYTKEVYKLRKKMKSDIENLELSIKKNDSDEEKKTLLKKLISKFEDNLTEEELKSLNKDIDRIEDIASKIIKEL